jgi:hypothetical protein
MITKTGITELLKDLEQIGWIVLTANSNHPMPTGMKGFPDHFMINAQKRIIVFIECKLGKDVMSVRQIRIADALLKCSSNTIHFYILTDKNYKEIIEVIAHL